MALYPKEHLYAVVLSNVQSGLVNRIPKDLEAVLFGGETSHPVEVKPEKVGAALVEYPGTSKAPEVPVPQNLVVQDGQLYRQSGSYPFLRIPAPTAKDEFFFRYEYARVRFEREQGKIVRMVWQLPESKPMAFQPTRLH